jgi:hypothetical protein
MSKVMHGEQCATDDDRDPINAPCNATQLRGRNKRTSHSQQATDDESHRTNNNVQTFAAHLPRLLLEGRYSLAV